MLKSDIDKSISTLIDTIKECNIEEMLQTLVEGEKKINTIDALKSYKKFINIYSNYNEFENQLIEIAGLGDLKHESLWSRFVRPDESDTAEIIHDLHASVQFLMNQLPKIQELGNADEDKISAVIEAGKNAGVEYVSLSVVVIEEEELSSPARLSSMLDGIQGLYEVAGRLQNLPVQDLIVTACDSGNDKQFSFLGASTIIAGVKDIILSFWDRVVFYREDKHGEYIKLLTKSLPVIQVINKMEKDGDLEKEEAEILRRRVIGSITKLTRAGITIPEMVEHSQHDPRELMRPDRKSLAHSVGMSADPFDESTELSGEYPAVVEDDDEEDDELIEEEVLEEPATVEEASEPEPVAEDDPFGVTQSEDEVDPEIDQPNDVPDEPLVSEDLSEDDDQTGPALESAGNDETSPAADDPFGGLDDLSQAVDDPTDIPSPEPEPVESKAEETMSDEDSFEDSDAFGVPPTPGEEKSSDAGSDEKDYSKLGEDIYMQASVDDVEVIVEDDSPIPPPAEAPVAESDLPAETELEEAVSEIEEPEIPEVDLELDDEATKKMDDEMDNVFERIAAGFLEMKQKEAEEIAKKEESEDSSEAESDKEG
jgi:hypothetical protein